MKNTSMSSQSVEKDLNAEFPFSPFAVAFRRISMQTVLRWNMLELGKTSEKAHVHKKKKNVTSPKCRAKNLLTKCERGTKRQQRD